jgi:hypothetical protein
MLCAGEHFYALLTFFLSVVLEPVPPGAALIHSSATRFHCLVWCVCLRPYGIPCADKPSVYFMLETLRYTLCLRPYGIPCADNLLLYLVQASHQYIYAGNLTVYLVPITFWYILCRQGISILYAGNLTVTFWYILCRQPFDFPCAGNIPVYIVLQAITVPCDVRIGPIQDYLMMSINICVNESR